MVSGRESDRLNWIDAAFVGHGFLLECHPSHGKSQARKLTAAMAMPTPKRTPARTRFEPPSPNANVTGNYDRHERQPARNRAVNAAAKR